jgi:hypothetical protein
MKIGLKTGAKRDDVTRLQRVLSFAGLRVDKANPTPSTSAPLLSAPCVRLRSTIPTPIRHFDSHPRKIRRKANVEPTE